MKNKSSNILNLVFLVVGVLGICYLYDRIFVRPKLAAHRLQQDRLWAELENERRQTQLALAENRELQNKLTARKDTPGDDSKPA